MVLQFPSTCGFWDPGFLRFVGVLDLESCSFCSDDTSLDLLFAFCNHETITFLICVLVLISSPSDLRSSFFLYC